jgi:hypothetical protein
MKRKQKSDKLEFIVMNKNNEVFSGMKNGGEFQWTSDWYKAKPLEYSSTALIKMMYSNIELIETENFY